MTYYNEELVAQWSDAALATNDPLLTPFRLSIHNGCAEKG